MAARVLHKLIAPVAHEGSTPPGAVEEGILHVLYACASQPQLCSKLADRTSDFCRPSDIVDDSFSQWKQPIVQQALSQIVATSCSSLYRPLLHACAGYLSSYSPSHGRGSYEDLV
ncbi:hypothetical protein L3X38_012342 [Prunus dulcis]|uniref:Uncharacterized protein n=1 Tax=Prunus dulcis TaxID=3755 RepID=A0AAD4WJ61_PRUDU|nr:hypothetical protein L3X38_012342 [Prunus dulcis]